MVDASTLVDVSKKRRPRRPKPPTRTLPSPPYNPNHTRAKRQAVLEETLASARRRMEEARASFEDWQRVCNILAHVLVEMREENHS